MIFAGFILSVVGGFLVTYCGIRLFAILRTPRIQPGEWRQVAHGVYLVNWSGDIVGLMQAARHRFPAFERIDVEAGPHRLWRIEITEEWEVCHL